MEFFLHCMADLYQAWSVGNKLWDIQTHTTSFTSERAYRHNALIFIRSTLYASPSRNFLLIPESEQSHFSMCDLFSWTSIVWVKELARTISPGPVEQPAIPAAAYLLSQPSSQFFAASRIDLPPSRPLFVLRPIAKSLNFVSAFST